MPLLGFLKRKPAPVELPDVKSPYHHAADLLDRDPEGWVVTRDPVDSNRVLNHRKSETRLVFDGGMPRYLNDFRNPLMPEIQALHAAYERWRSWLINKDLHDGP